MAILKVGSINIDHVNRAPHLPGPGDLRTGMRTASALDAGKLAAFMAAARGASGGIPGGASGEAPWRS